MDLLNVVDAAAFLGLSKRTLDGWRSRGSGPPYVKLGGLVRYGKQDLEAWLVSRTFTATTKDEAELMARRAGNEPKIHGHKRCRQCGEDKVLFAFAASKFASDGLRADCRDCMASAARRQRINTVANAR